MLRFRSRERNKKQKETKEKLKRKKKQKETKEKDRKRSKNDCSHIFRFSRWTGSRWRSPLMDGSCTYPRPSQFTLDSHR